MDLHPRFKRTTSSLKVRNSFQIWNEPEFQLVQIVQQDCNRTSWVPTNIMNVVWWTSANTMLHLLFQNLWPFFLIPTLHWIVLTSIIFHSFPELSLEKFEQTHLICLRIMILLFRLWTLRFRMQESNFLVTLLTRGNISPIQVLCFY